VAIRERLAKLIRQLPPPVTAQVVIFDPHTGLPIEGIVPDPTMATQVWLPKKGSNPPVFIAGPDAPSPELIQ
jgi:hypothetical protein